MRTILAFGQPVAFERVLLNFEHHGFRIRRCHNANDHLYECIAVFWCFATRDEGQAQIHWREPNEA